MSQSKAARVGLVVLAIAVVAGVGALVWKSQSDDDGRDDGADEESAQTDEERGRAPAPNQLGEGGDGANTPPTGDGGAGAGGSLHDRLGGYQAIKAITNNILEAVPRNPVIMANERVTAAARKVNVRKLHRRLTNWICVQAGGGCKYTGRPMKDYIDPLGLTAAEWAEVDKVVAATLAEMEVPDQEAQELQALFGTLRDDAATGN